MPGKWGGLVEHRNLYGFLGIGLEGRVSMNLLPLNTEIIAPQEWFEVHNARESVYENRFPSCPLRFDVNVR